MKLPLFLRVPPPEIVGLGKLIMNVSVEDEEGNIFCIFLVGTAYLVVCNSLGIEFRTEQASGIDAVVRILKEYYRIRLKAGEELRLTKFKETNEIK